MSIVKTIDLIDKLQERSEVCHEKIKAYFGLLAYWALAQAAVYENNEARLQKCKAYLGLYPDNFDHPHYNLEAYRVGGSGKAFLLMQGLWPEVEEDIRKYAEITYNAPRSAGGTMCRPSDDGMVNARIWIDCAAFTTPFMVYAGLALKEDKYIDFAADQCFRMYEMFLDETNGLLHQAKGFLENPLRISSDHWSRGNGWGIVGLIELIHYLPEENPHRKKAEAYLKDMVDSLIPYQTERGLWRQEIVEPLAWEESSGTGLILYAMGVGMRKGVLIGDKYREVFAKGIEGLAAYCMTEDYATYRSCPGCLCPGVGAMKGTPQAYLTIKIPEKDEVHSYGCFMLAFLEAHKNGITEVEIKGMVK